MKTLTTSNGMKITYDESKESMIQQIIKKIEKQSETKKDKSSLELTDNKI